MTLDTAPHQLVAIAGDGTTWDLTPANTLDDSPVKDSVRVSKRINGGDEAIDVILEDVGNPPRTMIPVNALLKITDPSYGPFCRTRVAEPGGDFRPDGSTLQIVGHGYGSSMTDEVFEHDQIFPRGTNIAAAMLTAITQLCPSVTPGPTLISPTITRFLLEESENFIRQTAQAVVNRLVVLGDSGGEQLIWKVHTVGDQNVFDVYKRPTVAKYHVKIEDLVANNHTWPLEGFYNRVLVWAAVGRGFAEDTASQANYPVGIGLKRTYTVDASHQLSSQGEAQVVAEALLAIFKILNPKNGSVKIPYEENVIVTDNNGNAVPIWLMEPGELLTIDGWHIDLPVLGTGPILIQSTEWEEPSRIQTLTSGELTLAQIVGKVIAATTPDGWPIGIPPKQPIPIDLWAKLRNPPASPYAPGTPQPIPSYTPDPTGGDGALRRGPQGGIGTADLPPDFERVPLQFGANSGAIGVPLDAPFGFFSQELPMQTTLLNGTLITSTGAGPDEIGDPDAEGSITIEIKRTPKETWPNGTATMMTLTAAAGTISVDVPVYALDIAITFNPGDVLTAVITAVDSVERTNVTLDTVRRANTKVPLASTTTPFALSDVVVVATDATRALVSWKTNIDATSQVKAWPHNTTFTAGEPDNFVLSDAEGDYQLDHGLQLQGLLPDTVYDFEIHIMTRDGVVLTLNGSTDHGGTFQFSTGIVIDPAPLLAGFV